jgi:putative photosynthetic complex assembly protein
MSQRAQGSSLVPRGAVLALGALLAASFVAAGAWRAADLPTRDADAAVVKQRALRFEDRPDGGVAVIDAASAREIETVHGEQGFLRGTLRGFARERKRRDLGSAPPFELAARADGRLTLIDPATGHRVDLDSFGPTNAAVFSRWLE